MAELLTPASQKYQQIYVVLLVWVSQWGLALPFTTLSVSEDSVAYLEVVEYWLVSPDRPRMTYTVSSGTLNPTQLNLCHL